MANCMAAGATIVHNIRPVGRAFFINDWQHRSNKRHQYGLPPIVASNGVWFCACGDVVGAGHNHTCNRVSGPATLERHESVLDTVQSICVEEIGLKTRRVPRIRGITDEDRNRLLIPDLVVESNDGEIQVAIDVSCVYGEATSNMPRGSPATKSAAELRSIAAVEKRESRNDVHYDVLQHVAGLRSGMRLFFIML